MEQTKSPTYQQFLQSIDKIDKSSFPNENERYAALDAARELCMRLETSQDRSVYQNATIPSTQMATRTVLNMGVFHKLSESNETSWTTAQLAEAVGADPMLLSRLLRHLSANKLLTERDADVWTANENTRDLTKREVSSGLDFLYEMILPSYLQAPEYLANTHYKNPTSTTDGIWQYATNSVGTPIFKYLYARPQMSKNFMEFMSAYTYRKQKWTDIYPTARLFSNDKGGPLIVDVGGGIGSDLSIFLKEYPEARDRLVLQDQAGVIENVLGAEGIKPMVHDFFNSQPVEGARVYLLHAVLHDWSDEECATILKQLKPAMLKGHSKVLVVECVVPSKGAHPESTTLDMTMLNLTGAWERTEEQWTTVFKAAGFKINDIHRGRLESVIEADAE